MRRIISYQQLLYGAVLLLSAELIIAYPAHLIIDHAGLFHDHHGEEEPYHDHEEEDEFCVVCLNFSSTEECSSQSIFLPAAKESRVFDKSKETEKSRFSNQSARAPPVQL